MEQDYEHLYLNDGNLEFQERLFDRMSEKTQNKIRVLQRVREVLLSSDIQYELFTLVALQGAHRDIFSEFGMKEEGIDFCFATLSKMFDEFTCIGFSDLEDFERKIIGKEIFNNFKLMED